MNDNKFQNLIQYKMVMSWAKSLLESSLITQREYAKIDTIMTKKYELSSLSIFR